MSVRSRKLDLWPNWLTFTTTNSATPIDSTVHLPRPTITQSANKQVLMEIESVWVDSDKLGELVGAAATAGDRFSFGIDLQDTTGVTVDNLIQRDTKVFHYSIHVAGGTTEITSTPIVVSLMQNGLGYLIPTDRIFFWMRSDIGTVMTMHVRVSYRWASVSNNEYIDLVQQYTFSSG